MISIGASSNDGIAFSALGLQAQHVGLRRKQGQIELVPGNGELLLDGASIETPQSLLLGMRFVLGQQSVWFFPEEN